MIFPPKNIDELKKAIKIIWDSIQINCVKYYGSYLGNMGICIKQNSIKLDKELLRKIGKVKKSRFNKIKNIIIFEGIRISYNDSFLIKLKDKVLSERRKNEEITEVNQIEKKLNDLKI